MFNIVSAKLGYKFRKVIYITNLLAAWDRELAKSDFCAQNKHNFHPYVIFQGASQVISRFM